LSQGLDGAKRSFDLEYEERSPQKNAKDRKERILTTDGMDNLEQQSRNQTSVIQISTESFNDRIIFKQSLTLKKTKETKKYSFTLLS